MGHYYSAVYQFIPFIYECTKIVIDKQKLFFNHPAV